VGAALEGWWRWDWRTRWAGWRGGAAGWNGMTAVVVGEVGVVDTTRCLGVVGGDLAVGVVNGYCEVGGHCRPVGAGWGEGLWR